MGSFHIEIDGMMFKDKKLDGNGYWEFPDAGIRLKAIDSSGGRWRVIIEHVFDPGDNEHFISGGVDHDGFDGTPRALGNHFAEVMYPGERRIIQAGELLTEVIFVHELGNHSHLPNLFRR